MKEEQILKEVEKTINALDLIPKLEANPFLFTRLKARIAAESLSQTKVRKTYTVLKPFWLAMILVINIITAVYYFTAKENTETGSTLISTLSQEYKTNQTQIENYKME